MAEVTRFPAEARSPAPAPDQLIAEKQVLSLRPFLSRGELLAARRQGLITWTEGKQHSPWYRLADVDDYVSRERERKCQGQDKRPSSNLTASGSAERSESPSSTGTGTIRPRDIAVARASAQRILAKQKSG